MSIVEPTAPPTPRIPRIAIRDQSPGQPPANVERTPSAAGSDTTLRPIPISHQQSTEASASPPPSPRWRQSEDASPQKEQKKKKGSIFGFLSVKEPSAKALEQYAEQQRQQAEAKGMKLIGPTTKLPVSVPKVNSKWDGLPDSVREAAKYKEQNTVQHMADARRPISTRNSLTTWGSVGSVRYPPSLASASIRFGTNGSNSSVSEDSDRIGTATTTSSVGYMSEWPSARPVKSLSRTSLPEIRCYLTIDSPQQEKDQNMAITKTKDDASLLTPSCQRKAQRGKPAPVQRSRSYELGDNVAHLSPFFTESVHPDDETPRLPQHSSPKSFSRPFNAPGFLAGEAQEMQMPQEFDHSRHLPLQLGTSRDSMTSMDAPVKPISRGINAASAPLIPDTTHAPQSLSNSREPSVIPAAASSSRPRPSRDVTAFRRNIIKGEALPWEDTAPPPEPIASTGVAQSETPKKAKGMRGLFGR